jgi:tetratricopeptide (TPR) repeat protein
MSSSDVEVTQDDYYQVAGTNNTAASAQKPAKMVKRLNNLFHGKNYKSSSNVSIASSERATTDSNDVESVAASTVAGNITIASVDTIKVSNRKTIPTKPIYEQTTKRAPDTKKNPWKKLKKMMGSKGEEETTPFGRSRSLSHPNVVLRDDHAYPMRKRVESEQSTRTTQSSRRNIAAEGQELDDAIRGRFDGMDILSLGSARLVSVPRSPDLLTRNAPMLTAADLVSDMLRTSSGRSPPELVLEGFIANDRWLVRLESMYNKNDNVPQLQSTDDESTTDGSPKLSTPKLLASIWGRDRSPPPSHAQPEEGDEDDLFQLAASCSVPIDIDEETFIIDTPAHCQAVHDIAAVPLKAGRFDDAIDIFQKILKGLEMRHGDQPHHLIGTTLHNIGLLLLWKGQYKEAWKNFNQAASVRMESLSKNHPDIAVSLSREGIALFALEKYNDALFVLEQALHICCSENATRAKILNNMGVVYYQQRDDMQAMAAFAGALEIQRIWLDNRVRRNSIIFDASITMGNMGKLYLEQENYHLSFFVNEEALLLQTTAFPKDHDIVLRSLDSIAYARAREGDYEKAIHLYRGILRSQDARFGPYSKESMGTTKLMGILLIKEEDYEEALKCFTTLLKWQKARLPNNDPELQQSKEYIRNIEKYLDGVDQVSVWV